MKHRLAWVWWGFFPFSVLWGKSTGHPLLDILPNTWRRDSASQVQPELGHGTWTGDAPPLLSNPCPVSRPSQGMLRPALCSPTAWLRLAAHLCPLGRKPRPRGPPAGAPGSRARPLSARAGVNKVLARRKRKRRVSMAAAAAAAAGPVFWRRLLGLLPGRPGLAALLGRLSDRLGRNPDRRRRR